MLSLLFLFSCEKQNLQILNTLELASSCPQCVRFDALAVGQTSYYQGISGEAFYQSENPLLIYQEDTLVLKVVDRQGDVFTLEESIITASTDEVFQYQIKVDKENITISKPKEGGLSNLFAFQRNKSLVFPLDLKDAPPARTKGWFIENDCDLQICYYRMDEFMGSKDISVYIDYSPMAYDGNGYYAIYDQIFLYRTMGVGSWTATGSGWELID